ncbi:MAG: glucosamine-6-phosphate deaminase [Sphaerochaeta sp.]|jgi:glucosamine-6-phosphate deaminase|nr:glucosamine-6-phosphate deaminase [Sphaerochaeta sp.]
MRIIICEDKNDLGLEASKLGINLIRQAIEERGEAAIAVGTGLSQFSLYAHLCKSDLDWSKVTAFGLNEYVGISPSHPSSFRYYLQTRFIKRVDTLKAYHEVQGDAADLEAEVARLNALSRGAQIDVAFLSIGENGHIGFNDPPADFNTTDPYIIVQLDERCRRQQVGEGWFSTLEEVPTAAITMSVRHMLHSRHVICSVPDQRKARAVAMCLYDQISPYSPASALRTKRECSLFLDRTSSMLVMGDRR